MKPTKRTMVFAAALIVVAVALSFIILSDDVPSAHSKLPTGSLKPKVATGDNHGVILASDGTLWTWGDCEFGWHVLGLGNTITNQPSLRQIGTDSNWVDVAS